MSIIILYVDPGSSGYLIQAIVAAIVGVSIYFKTIMHKIKSFLGIKHKEKKPTESNSDE